MMDPGGLSLTPSSLEEEEGGARLSLCVKCHPSQPTYGHPSLTGFPAEAVICCPLLHKDSALGLLGGLPSKHLPGLPRGGTKLEGTHRSAGGSQKPGSCWIHRRHFEKLNAIPSAVT